jgi:hypothetical protein
MNDCPVYLSSSADGEGRATVTSRWFFTDRSQLDESFQYNGPGYFSLKEAGLF